MNISSLAFDRGAPIPKKYTCEGDDISPPLSISGVPRKAKSLALIVSDPDAQSGDFVHWIMWNIDPQTEIIQEGITPDDAREGVNDFGRRGWNGPCPPAGTHRYEFHVYALDTNINLAPTADKMELRAQIQGRILEEAVFMGTYEKGSTQ